MIKREVEPATERADVIDQIRSDANWGLFLLSLVVLMFIGTTLFFATMEGRARAELRCVKYQVCK